MADQPANTKPFAQTGGMIAARADQGSQLFLEVIGTSFLGLLVFIGFFALLRAQKRNRDLMRELMECKVALAKATQPQAEK